MTDLFVLGIIVIIVACAVAYLVKAKKSGARCVGCPDGGQCAGKSGGHSGCTCGCQSEKLGDN